MAIEVFNRYEHKYIVDKATVQLQEHRLQAVWDLAKVRECGN